MDRGNTRMIDLEAWETEIARTPGKTAKEFYDNLEPRTRAEINWAGLKWLVLAAWRASAVSGFNA